jgi:hypothetical protein
MARADGQAHALGESADDLLFDLVASLRFLGGFLTGKKELILCSRGLTL